jgi:threonine/homoserine efflux transporter RhtA
VAASILISRHLGEQAHGLDGLVLSIAVAALVTLPVSATAALHTAQPLDIPVVAAIGALGIAIPYALEFSALCRVGVRTHSIPAQPRPRRRGACRHASAGPADGPA